MTKRPLLVTLLATLLLASQTLLAWHDAEHIDLDLGHAQSVHECPLGSQAHSPGLPGSAIDLLALTSSQSFHTFADASAPKAAVLFVEARGPPSCLI